MVTCYPSYDMTPPLPSPAQCGASATGVGGGPGAAHKDYSRPLHVDCSVEYELPDAAKPPAGQRSEPLLMIHPCYYRRAEAQRRTRFVNNLPKSMSSPVTSSSSSSSSGRRSKVARLASSAVEPSWPQPKPLSVPVYPANVANQPPACYKVGATADFSTASTASWPGRTPAAPSSAKLDAGAVLSDIIASTCSELNNNYMKPSQPQSQAAAASSQQSSSHSQSSASTGGAGSGSQLYERQLGGSCAGGVSSYQQLPGYHPHHDSAAAAAAATTGLLSSTSSSSSSSCKTCQYQPQHHHSHQHSHHSHHHSSSSGSSTTAQPHPASQATQVNRLYGGGLVKAVEPELASIASNPVPAKARRCGVKRSRSSRALPSSQDCARATPSWSDAMLHLNASGFAFESAAAAAAVGVGGGVGAGVWYSHQGTPQHQHHPHAPVPMAAPVPGATAADPLGAPLPPLGSVAWGPMGASMGGMFCREREDETRVLWNSDSLLRLVPV